MTFDIWFQMVGGFKCCCVTLHSTPTSTHLWTFALCNFALHHLFNSSQSATRGFVKAEGRFPHFCFISNIQESLLRGSALTLTLTQWLDHASYYCKTNASYYLQMCNLLVSANLRCLCRLQPFPGVASPGFFCQPTQNQT